MTETGHIPVDTLLVVDAAVRHIPNRAVAFVNEDGSPWTPTLGDIGEPGGPVGPAVATGSIVYGTNLEGAQSPVSYGSAPSAFTLVMRDIDGNFTVHDPTAAGHSASMQWVQAEIAGIPAAAWGDITGKPTTFPAASIGVTGGPVGPVVATVEIVYGTNSAGQSAALPYATGATGFTLCYRDTVGRVQVASGSASTDAANMGQLDARLSDAQRTAINALAAIATADATDAATTMALANECKASINAVIAALKA